ncbi:MAG TPA: hypothetical protein VJ888_06410 [Mobilitalea sp.]|nr:hypothetical protein [Mobilitalea sp.]
MSLFPFVTPNNKETGAKKRNNESQSAVRYEQKLAEYSEALDQYKKCIQEYSIRLEDFNKKPAESKYFVSQAEPELAFIKKQGDSMLELLAEMRAESDSKASEQANKLVQSNKVIEQQQESLTATLIDTNYKLEGLDKNVIGRISEVLVELQKQNLYAYKQNHAEMQANLDRISKAVKRGKVLSWFMFAFQVLSLGGIAFIILYLLEIIII